MTSKIRIVAVGDPHIKPDNIHEVNIFIDKLEIKLKEIKPDLIVILGDVLHTHERVNIVALNKAYEFFERMRAISPTIVLVGNHDMANQEIFLTENHWMNALKKWKNIQIADRVLDMKINGHIFLFCPYVPNGRFIEALNTSKVDWKTATAIFAHQEFRGCKMGAYDSETGDEWQSNFPNIISGHIHDRQTLNNIYYCGSSMQHSFGENGKHIIPILTWEKSKQYSLEEIDLGLPCKKTVYVDTDDIDEIKLPEKSDDKLKVSISGDFESFKTFKKTKKYKKLIEQGAKVVFKPKRVDDDKQPIKEVDEKDFTTILVKLIEDSENKRVLELYKRLFSS